MILRCLPTEVLADDISKFEANGSAATEIGLPMQMILTQLPSGKVEVALQDLIPHFPPGFLQPTESIVSYLPTMVNLPLMDVVMRIPPDLLALRPDQKDVDASVINMADPFTEEILREQAENARRQSQPNIIEESQAPQEEFVPRDQQALKPMPGRVTQSLVPPRRPAAEPLIPGRGAMAATTLAAASPMASAASMAPTAPMTPPPPTPHVFKAPPPPPAVSTSASLPKPTVPAPASSISGRIQIPSRATTPIRPAAEPALPAALSAPVPPVPRHTGPIPAPPPPRHTTSLPVPRRTGVLPSVAPTISAAVPAPEVPTPTIKTEELVATSAPDANADDLQRLAALAMVQMGETGELPEVETVPEPGAAAVAESVEEPVSEPVEEPSVADPAPVEAATLPPAPAIVSEPEPEEDSFIVPPMPAVEPIRAPVARPEPIRAPVPSPEPIRAPAPQPAAAEPSPVEPEAPPASGSVAFNLNTCTQEELVHNIRDCPPELAASIIRYRTKIGSFKKLEELLDVPGMTKAAYTNLTGEAPPSGHLASMLTVNELLGFPEEQQVSLKDVTDRIACWPDVTGCVLSQSSGLSLVGTVASGVNKAAIVAFAPRMFESINKSFAEVSGQETDALVIPATGTSFHLFRNQDLYLIIMCRLPQMPERHLKVARFVLAALEAKRV
jgi:hypothetical protein